MQRMKSSLAIAAAFKFTWALQRSERLFQSLKKGLWERNGGNNKSSMLVFPCLKICIELVQKFL